MKAKDELAQRVDEILRAHNPSTPVATAEKLRCLWLQYEPRSIEVIKADLRDKQETVGIPVPVLKDIGQGIGKVAGKRVDDFLPLAQLLWDEYGREGRVVAVMPLGAMELADPARLVPLLRDMCRTCLTWEDADRFAMYAVEPIVRKDPDEWLGAIEPWLDDESKWVRRAGVTVVGRLPLKQPQYAAHCLELIERLLHDDETDVRRAVSFAIRLVAVGDAGSVREFLGRHIPAEDSAATWILCDAIRSMTARYLPEFAELRPLYEEWAADESLGSAKRRSIEGAVSALKKAKA